MNGGGLKKILFILFGAGIAFGTLEILCRWVSPPPKVALQGLTHISKDSSLPCELTPNFTGKNHGVEIRTNRFGWRDREWKPHVDHHHPRILLVGDSFVLGLDVPLENLLGRQIEKYLGEKVEVCMAGCIYYNTSNELLIAQRLVPLLKPDLILVSYVLNDAEPSHRPESPYQIYHRIESWLIFHSRFLFFLRIAIHSSVAKIQALMGAPDYYTALYQEDQPGWQENRRSFKAFADFSKSTGVPVYFLIWLALDRLDATHPYHFIYQKIEAALRDHSIPHLNLFHAFEGRAAPSLWVSSLDAHPNAIAFQLAAQATTDFLFKKRILRINHDYSP